MASGIQNQKEYERAKTAYITGNYEEAANILEKLAQENPTDPEILLLRGHIYCCFQEFEQAEEQYNLVIDNTDNQDLIDLAYSGLETVKQWQETGAASHTGNVSGQPMGGTENSDWSPTNIADSDEGEPTGIWMEEENLPIEASEDEATGALNNQVSENPFADSSNHSGNPFADLSEDEITAISALDDEDDEEITGLANTDSYHSESSQSFNENSASSRVANSQGNSVSGPQSNAQGTLLYSPDQGANIQEEDDTAGSGLEEEDFDFSQYTGDDFLEDADEEDNGDLEDTFGENRTQKTKNAANRNQNFSDLSGQFGDGEITGLNEYSSNLEEVEEQTPEFDLDEVETGHFQTSRQSAIKEQPTPPQPKPEVSEQALFTSSAEEQSGQLFSSTPSSSEGSDLSFDAGTQDNEPIIEQEQGVLGFFENWSLDKKRRGITGAVGIASAVLVAAGSFAVSSVGENKPGFVEKFAKSVGVGLIGGAASAGVSWFIGGQVVKQIKRSTGDLQAQLYAVQQGNLEAKATVYSQDEFGQLAASFNQMTRVVSTTTNEAQRKAQEQEQAKEDLQRQVIRLLDDVEGAARGDLTVQAEVSADVLGAVADAFNLTIRNLRTIVQQVKEAARQVNEGSAESESFARGLSEDALRQAEELAVSLNSAQMMTESIQRVADNAKEAEAVARTASETALKGGEAVDSTVAGILQIRETVAQSTRKVKRLAESSQEISKIVSVISQIATRTNSLALNASIEAARAGEAGRGFAVIADEVRQLADRSTKSLREIEKIVLQIQSETSSVMIAMEEGTQQVIEGTQRAEQAKNALEDIIQVSNRIDSLVQSITADTVEQSETAQSVAQVMQSVEMTAQGTSQESQQVSTALQNLVSLAGDLLASVERFRVNPEDDKTS